MADILFYSPSTGRKIWFIDPEMNDTALAYVIDWDYGYNSPEFKRNPTEFMRRLANITDEELESFLDRLYVVYREFEMDEYEANDEVEKDEKVLRRKINRLRELFARYPDLRVIYYSVGGGRTEGWVGSGFKKMFKL
jgi:hypothetical protein